MTKKLNFSRSPLLTLFLGIFFYIGLLFFNSGELTAEGGCPGGMSGEGTEGNPCQITTIEQLDSVRDELGMHYDLMNNLDFSNCDDWESCPFSSGDYDTWKTTDWDGGDGWTPIGDSTTSFTGTFDGTGHKIDNLFVDRSATTNVGLFGKVGVSGSEVGAEVNNIGVENVSINGDARVAGLVGHNFGTISNSYSKGSVTGADTHVGCLVGRNRSPGTILDSHSNCEVNGDNSVGGLAGSSSHSGVSISNSHAKGPVSGNERVGGLVGSVYFGSVSNSYSTGSVTGSDSRVGGFVGHVNWTTISNSYSTGDVTRAAGDSGLFGGFIGNSGDGGTVRYSYSTGSVFYDGASDPTNKGFGGLKGSVTFTNNFFDSDASNQNTDVAGTADPKTDSEMKNILTFSNAEWDIAATFAADPTDGRPFLSWQIPGSSPAWYIYGDPYTLTVSKDGTGSGTVTGDPAGIDCGETCENDFADGTEVTLTAEAGDRFHFRRLVGGRMFRNGNLHGKHDGSKIGSGNFHLK